MSRSDPDATASRLRRRAVRSGRRAIEAVGGRRLIAGLGAAFLLVAVAVAVACLREGRGVGRVLVTFVLVAAPAAGLVVGGVRLPRADLHDDFHATIAGWCLAGLGVMAAGVALYHHQPGEGFALPAQSAPVLLALGCFAGFSAGVHDALARSRARELSHRNRQLRRTREELESTVEQLRSSNERLEQFAYAASHDLQEPLRMVSSYLRLLETRHGDALDVEAEEFLAFAVEGADRMRAMIDGLLTYSRVQTDGRPLEPVDLEAVLADVRTDLQVCLEQRDATVEVGPLPTVRGDERQLRQVFQNLLENAVEYGGEEPHVEVFVADGPRPPAHRGSAARGGERAAAASDEAPADGSAERAADAAAETDESAVGASHERATDPRAAAERAAGDAGARLPERAAGDADARTTEHAGESTARRAGDEADVESGERAAGAASDANGAAPDATERPDTWTVAVRDDGIGIDPEHTERIFEVFERLHGREEYDGTGIGLALCERVVDRHGGSIRVDSVPGEGSTFYVELPAARTAPGVGDVEEGADERAAEDSEAGDAGGDADATDGTEEPEAGTADGDSGDDAASADARSGDADAPPVGSDERPPVTER